MEDACWSQVLLALALAAIPMTEPIVGAAAEEQQPGVQSDDQVGPAAGLFACSGGPVRGETRQNADSSHAIGETATWVTLPNAILRGLWQQAPPIYSTSPSAQRAGWSTVGVMTSSESAILDNGVPVEPYDGVQAFFSANADATHKGNWVRRVGAGNHTLVVQVWILDGAPAEVLTAWSTTGHLSSSCTTDTVVQARSAREVVSRAHVGSLLGNIWQEGSWSAVHLSWASSRQRGSLRSLVRSNLRIRKLQSSRELSVAVQRGRLTASIENSPIHSVLEELSSRTQIALVAGSGLEGDHVSAELKDVPVDEGLRDLLKNHDAFFYYGAAGENTKAVCYARSGYIPRVRGQPSGQCRRSAWAGTKDLQASLADE